METIEATVTIGAGVDGAWAVLTDIESVAKWVPTVTTAVRTSEQASGVGVSRHCELVEGFGTLDETITEWDERRAISWNMRGEGGLPVTHMVGRYSLATTVGGTEASFAMDYELLDGVPQEVQGEIEAAFQMVVPAIVAGLKRYIETGQGTTYDEMVDSRA